MSVGFDIPIKDKVDEYLIGFRHDELGTIEKRCYFEPINQSRNYSIYKVDSIEQNITQFVEKDDLFITAYIACFLRDNKEEIEKNYKNIYKIVEEVSKNR